MIAWVVIDRRHLRHSTPIPSSLRAAPAPTSSGSLLTIALSRLDATFMNVPVSVANKRLTGWLNPLDATLTKNRGWGAVRLRAKCSAQRLRKFRQLLSFQPIVNSFAPTKITNLFFSVISKLFAKNNRGGGIPLVSLPAMLKADS